MRCVYRNLGKKAHNCGSKDSLLTSIVSRRDPEQRRAARVRDILVSDAQRISKFDWVNPDKSSFCYCSTLLSIFATTLSMHLCMTVYRWPNSSPEKLTVSQNISINNLSVHLDPFPSCPFSLTQLGLSKASTSP